MPELSPKKRGIIAALYEQGLVQREISQKLGCSLSTVSRTLKRHKEDPQLNFTSKMRSGRPRATTSRTDKLIGRISHANPRLSANEISKEIFIEKKVSDRTVRRRLLVDFKMKACKPAKKPFLSLKNLKDRKTFCQRYKNWTGENWSKVLFSDETCIKQFNVTNNFVRRPKNCRYMPKYTVSSVKAPVYCMVWGAISAKGRGSLWIMPKNTAINRKVYLDVMKEKLPPFMQILNCTYFQQDGAPCHTAKIVKKWFADEGIQTLGNWPGSSPDLNVIENCWHIMKVKVAAKKPRSYNDLVEAIKSVWSHEITPDYCTKLVNSMPKRIQMVIDNNYASIKY